MTPKESAEYFDDEASVELANAVGLGATDAIITLIESGANPNIVSRSNMTPLLWACIKKKYASVETLVQYGSDPNLLSPLGLCSLLSWFDGVSILLRAGANPNMQDSDGDTPLHSALIQALDDIDNNMDASKIFALLLKNGANPWIVNAFDRSPMLIATELGSEPMIRLLLESSNSHEVRKEQADKIREACKNRGSKSPL